MHNNFWDYLYQTFELIEDMNNENQDLLSQVNARLETIELLYARQFDPVDSYEEFVAVKLINAISQAIKRQ
ncbi:hypothetical protein [Cognaticolwellia aestuarii]|uniref:hypothetical protein n=1 Tax=Cognaticolwellia aestuarii TaxID=329993 RepID=UPI0009856B94|nr:hypothetical protein [Cognaticolwellia aestuarii]